MDKIIIDWRLAGWAENALVVCIGLALAGLAFWLVCNAVKDVLDRAIRYEKLRKRKSEEAVNRWVEVYKDEHALRIAAEQKAEQERNMRKQIAKGAKQNG